MEKGTGPRRLGREAPLFLPDFSNCAIETPVKTRLCKVLKAKTLTGPRWSKRGMVETRYPRPAFRDGVVKKTLRPALCKVSRSKGLTGPRRLERTALSDLTGITDSLLQTNNAALCKVSRAPQKALCKVLRVKNLTGPGWLERETLGASRFEDRPWF